MLTSILFAVQILLLATFGFVVAYLFVLSILAACARTPARPEPHTRRRFAVLIPAHNEEFTIIPTIQSIFRLDYPRERFDLFVIADNCTDRTAEVSKSRGAIVLERTDDLQRGKGHALRWCMDRLLSQTERYDAFVVVDADSVISSNFLYVMNGCLEQGAKVMQSSDLVSPQPTSWNSEMTRLGFVLYNHVRPLGRQVIGCSAGLRGNGMCFAAEVLRSHPWQAYSRTEDLEFGLHLLLKGIPVTFVPDAGVLATMPQNPQLAESQRARWEGGRFPVIKKFASPLLQEALLRHSLRCADAFIDLVTLPLINLMALVSCVLFVTVVLYVAGLSSMLSFALIWTIVFVCGFLHMFIGLYAARADKSLYKALFHLPRFTMWKAFLYLKLVQRGETKEWIRTTREPAVAHEKSAKI